MLRRIPHLLLLLFVGIAIASLNLAAGLAIALIGRERTRRVFKPLVVRLLRLLRFLVRVLGVGNFEFAGFENGRTPEPCLIIANHTGLLDALMLLVQFPDAVCIFKHQLRRNPFLRHLPGAVGFLANDAGLDLVHDVIRHLRAGRRVLIFPEGTRTTESPVNRFQGGFAVAARRACAPVQCVLIRNPSGITSKAYGLFGARYLPFRYHFERGATLAPRTEESTKAFTARVEHYYRQTLASPDGAPVPCI